jgi:hypothetical protein
VINPPTLRRAATLALLALATTVLTACSRTYSRGMFEGYVMGQTEQEVTEKVGKPDAVDEKEERIHRFVYRQKTFDTERPSVKDNEATILFEKKDGKYVAIAVQFS